MLMDDVYPYMRSLLSSIGLTFSLETPHLFLWERDEDPGDAWRLPRSVYSHGLSSGLYERDEAPVGVCQRQSWL